MAERLIYSHEKLLSGIRLQVLRDSFRFWSSPNFIRIGSASQQLYLTFLVYHMVVLTGASVFETDNDLFEDLRNGIQERIQKVGTVSEAGYTHGLLLWKLYMDFIGFNEEDNDEAE
jgi:hypothetical protein